VERVAVNLRHDRTEEAGRRVDRIEVDLLLGGDLSPEQEERLRQVAQRCPVHRALKGEVAISERPGA
jgi:putative redox protein